MSKILKTFSALSLLTFFMSEGMQTNDQSVDDRRLVPYANNPVSESLVKLGILGKIKHIDVASQYFGTNTPPWTESNDICYRAFFSYSRTTEIFIPFGIKSIGDKAFDECKNLRSLYLTTTILCLAESFLSHETICKGCDNLISVTVPEHLKRYFDLINRGRKEKTDDKLPVCKIKTIEEKNINEMFFYTDQLNIINTNNKKLQVPKDTVVIMPGIFDKYPDIEEVDISKSVQYISDCSFNNFKKLRKVNIPANSELEVIGGYAFSNTTIESISIPKSVSAIGDYAFEFCEFLRRVDIPSDSEFKHIGKYAFKNTSIKSIFIPKSVSAIGDCAFEFCEFLIDVNIGDDSSLNKIGPEAFNSTAIENIVMPKTLKYVGNDAFLYSRLRSIEFLSDDITIDEGCFSYCQNLIILSFPNVVRVSLGKDSFYGANENFSLFTVPNTKAEEI